MTEYGDQNYIYLDLDFIGKLVLSHCLLFTAVSCYVQFQEYFRSQMNNLPLLKVVSLTVMLYHSTLTGWRTVKA